MVAKHFRVAEPGVLDPDCGPVEAHRVPATDRERDELDEPPGAGDDEVRAYVWQLMQLRIRMVGGKRVVDRRRRARLGPVLDDHPRVPYPPGAFAIVPLGVGAHLPFSLLREW